MQKEVDYPHIRSICEEKNIPIEEGSNTDLWRMSAEPGFDVLGLKRRKPVASLDDLVCSGGAASDDERRRTGSDAPRHPGV